MHVHCWELLYTVLSLARCNTFSVWVWWLHLPPMGGCFDDTAELISQLDPIVLLLNEGWEMGGSLSKGTVAGSISEFIKQLTCSYQYLLIITGFCGRSRCHSAWPYYQWPLVTDNSWSFYFVGLNIWNPENNIKSKLLHGKSVTDYWSVCSLKTPVSGDVAYGPNQR